MAVKVEDKHARHMARVYKENSGWLHSYFRNRLDNEADAEDGVHQTFLRYFRRMERSGWQAKIDNLGGYLKVTAQRVLTEIRRKSGWAFTDSLDDEQHEALRNGLTDQTAFSEDAYCRQDEVHKLRQALLKGLKPVEKRAITMYKGEGKSHEDIAAALDLSVEIVKREINSAHAKISYRVKQILRERARGKQP
jgi:RNA polymerase sigma factor (sigma-70 family)